jgi:hypothetical protein
MAMDDRDTWSDAVRTGLSDRHNQEIKKDYGPSRLAPGLPTPQHSLRHGSAILAENSDGF